MDYGCDRTNKYTRVASYLLASSTAEAVLECYRSGSRPHGPCRQTLRTKVSVSTVSGAPATVQGRASQPRRAACKASIGRRSVFPAESAGATCRRNQMLKARRASARWRPACIAPKFFGGSVFGPVEQPLCSRWRRLPASGYRRQRPPERVHALQNIKFHKRKCGVQWLASQFETSLS